VSEFAIDLVVFGPIVICAGLFIVGFVMNWRAQNRALAAIRRGLKQSADGKTRSLGSFAKYVDDE
jgi:hypothetical protein